MADNLTGGGRNQTPNQVFQEYVGLGRTISRLLMAGPSAAVTAELYALRARRADKIFQLLAMLERENNTGTVSTPTTPPPESVVT